MARQRTPEGPPPPPAVQKIRLRYAKRGRLRFSSTRDFQRALERALGAVLFDRSSRATELTAAGRALLDAAPRVLFEAERARDRVRQAANGAVGLLVVGSVGTALASIAPRILRSVRAAFPDLQLEVSQQDTAAQLVALADDSSSSHGRPPLSERIRP